MKPNPTWTITGGCILAFMSAAVNAGFLVHLGASVSHLTGDISRIAADLIIGDKQMVASLTYLTTATLGFVIGATAAGYSIHHLNLDLSRPYGRAIAVVGICLLGAHFCLIPAPAVATFLAGFGCGLQNGLAAHYRGLILRTTHVTGLFTDLGSAIGMKLHGHNISTWKIAIPALLILSFFCGAAFGAILVIRLHAPFLLILAIMYITGGGSWTLLKHKLMPYVTSQTDDPV